MDPVGLLIFLQAYLFSASFFQKQIYLVTPYVPREPQGNPSNCKYCDHGISDAKRGIEPTTVA